MTWTHAGGGYSLFFNRDEFRVRPPEHPPKRWDSHGPAVLAPLDDGGNGTWIAVNEHGLTAALLNHYTHETKSPEHPRSRGGIPLMAAGHRTVSDAVAWASAATLSWFKPFYLLIVDSTSHAALLTWDGVRLEALNEARPPVTSSSFCPGEVATAREEQFRAMLQGGVPPTAAQLEAFHRSTNPKGGAWSVWMSRADACTRSLIRIDVNPAQVSMRYEVAHAGYSVGDGPGLAILPRATAARTDKPDG